MCCGSCRGLFISSINNVGLSFLLVQTIIFVFFILFRNPGKVELSNLDNLGESYDPWSPGELCLVLNSTGSCGVEWDVGCEPFTVLYMTF